MGDRIGLGLYKFYRNMGKVGYVSVFNPVAPYRYLLPNLYLYVADIANPDLLASSSRTWIRLDIERFYKLHYQPSSGTGFPKKNGNRAPIAGGRKGSTQFAQDLPDRCDSSTACMLCRLEPCTMTWITFTAFW